MDNQNNQDYERLIEETRKDRQEIRKMTDIVTFEVEQSEAELWELIKQMLPNDIPELEKLLKEKYNYNVRAFMEDWMVARDDENK